MKKTEESKISTYSHSDSKTKNDYNHYNKKKLEYEFSEKSASFSSDFIIYDEKKCENGQTIIGLDDIKIPSFLNEIKKEQNMDKLLKNYYKIKEELGSNELTELYLIDINRLIKVYQEKNKN